MRSFLSYKIYLYFCLAINICGIHSYDGYYLGKISLFLPVIISLCICFFSLMDRLYGRVGNSDILEPDFVFLLMFAVFHFAYIWFYLAGIADYDKEVFWVANLVPIALYYCNFCLVFFLLGYGRSISIPLEMEWNASSVNYRKLLFASKILVVFCVICFWLPLVDVGISEAFSDYKVLIGVGGVSAFGKLYFFGQYIAVAGISLYCLSSGILYKKCMYGKFKFVVIFYIFQYLLIGDRGGFVSYSIILVLAYHIFQKRIPVKVLLISFSFFLVISSIVSATRTVAVFNPVEMIQLYSDKAELSPVSDALIEFGSSLKTVVIAMSLIPERYDYWYGSSYLYSLSLTVPNFLGASRGAKHSPGAWLTETAFDDLGKTHGRGGSIAMEAYLNFGFAAGSVSFFFIGLVLKKTYYLFVNRRDVFWAVAYFALMSAFALWMRNTSAFVPRTMIWTLLITFFLQRTKFSRI